jgi:predicted permease
MNTFWKDLIYATRRLLARPGFLAVTLMVLTLGVGVNAAIFTFINGLLVRPLPVAEPSRLATLAFNAAGMSQGMSFPNYLDIRDRSQVFSSVAAMRVMPMALSLANRSDRIWGYLVTGNYFDLLGITPARGRFINVQDDGASPAPVAVISYACWRSRFAADPEIVGKLVKINGERFNVIGVAPPGFIGTERFFASEVWVPFSVIRIIEGRDWRTSRGTQNAWGIARLKPGVTHARAEASLAVLAAQMRRENPIGNENFAIHLAPVGLLGNFLRNSTIGITSALLIVGALTLVVACTNLAGLILAQAADRRKEMAIRMAIGASRGAIVRMMLLESLLIGTAGGIGGLIAAAWASKAIQAWIPSSGVPLAKFTTDWRVVVFGAGVALLTALLSGLAPSLRAAGVDVGPALKNESAGGIRGWHLRDVYLGIQVTVCMVLLTASVSTIRALQNTLATRFGFDPDHAVMLRVDLAMSQYAAKQGLDFDRRLIERIRAIPGIEAAGLANSVPFSVDQSNWGFRAEGRPLAAEKQVPSASVYQSGPGYLRAAGTRLLSGRDFDERDRDGAPKVVIVNETLVREYLPPGDPIGKRIGAGHDGDWMQIVGVVEAGRYQSIGEDPMPAFWVPLEQSYNSAATVVIRTRRPEAEVLADARKIVAELNPDVPIFEAQPLSAVLDFPMAPLRLSTGALTVMGGLAALLCALGLYGLLAYSVVQRTREIGIRVALGARSGNVLGLLVKRTMLLVAASGAAGIVLSVFAMRVLGQYLFAQAGASVYGPVVMLLAAIALIACAVPARRVLRIHPSDALRQE